MHQNGVYICVVMVRGMVAGLIDHQMLTTRSDADLGLKADSHVVG